MQGADDPGPSGRLTTGTTGLRFDGGVYVFANPNQPPPTAVTAPQQPQNIDPHFQWPPPQIATGKDGGARAGGDGGAAGANGQTGANGGSEVDAGATIELW
jgi:hypothetical protein